MDSLNFTALFSLLDKEKQQMLLSQVNILPTQEKEVGQGASVRASPAQQSVETPAPAVNSFTAEELLAPTGKVHTAAQKYFKFMLKEASRRAGIWDKALQFNKISPEKWNVFNKLVVEFCPQLKGQLHRVKTALSVSLVNRRNYLRRSGKIQKKSQTKDFATAVEELQPPKNAPPASVSNIGNTVNITFKGTVIGRGVLLKEEDDLFSRVLLRSKFLNAPTGTINLPQETQGKTMFGELEIGTEFLWKTERLSAVGRAKSGAKSRKSQKNVKNKNARSHSLSVPSSPPIPSHDQTPSLSPPMQSLTPSSPSSSPICSHTPSSPSSSPILSNTPSAPSSPSILVGTSSVHTLSAPPTQNSTTCKPAITPCIGHRGYVNVPAESFTPTDIFKPVAVTSKRMRKAKKPVDL